MSRRLFGELGNGVVSGGERICLMKSCSSIFIQSLLLLERWYLRKCPMKYARVCLNW